MRKIIPIVLAVMVVAVGFNGVFAQTEDRAGHVKTQETKIEKVIAVRNRPATAKLTDTVEITGGEGRKVRLERWNRTQERWIVRKTYDLKDTEKKQRIKIEYPENWSSTTYATWRIRVPEGISDDGKIKYEGAETKVETIAYNRYKVPLKARAACIMDEEGHILYSKNSTVKRAMASTTKMMTATLVIERGMMNSNVTVSKWAAGTPWGILFLRGGEEFTMRGMMNAMLIGSSNESANAIAQKVGGSKTNFVAMMNRRAASLGLKNTHYNNPHGLDSNGHYSTARDVTKLLMHVSKYEDFRNIASKQSYILRDVNRTDRWKIKTTNPLLGKVDGVLYGKTGFEDNAGYCLAVAYKPGQKKYYVTTLGNFTYEGRSTDQKKLYRYARQIKI